MADFKNSELWRFRPSTLEWTWMSGDGPNKDAIYGGIGEFSNEFTPASSTGGSMVYAGNSMLIYWQGYSYYCQTDEIQKSASFSAIFSYNNTEEQWSFSWGNMSNSSLSPVYAKFGQSNRSNNPGSWQRTRSLTRGNIWLIRGVASELGLALSNTQDSFIFPVADPCSSDVNQCSINAKCTSHQSYYDCECNEGYQGNGRTCSVPQPQSPIAAPNHAHLVSVTGLVLVASAMFSL